MKTAPKQPGAEQALKSLPMPELQAKLGTSPDGLSKAEAHKRLIHYGQKKMDAAIESIDDASITALVKTTLLYHRSTSALNTTVVTNEGVVKLGGKAGSAAEKDLAAKLVSDVHGVKRVVNNMTVEKT